MTTNEGSGKYDPLWPGELPVGYKRTKQGANRTIAVHLGEAETVRTAFSLAAKGLSVRQAARELEVRRLYGRGARFLTVPTLARMLRDRRYMGAGPLPGIVNPYVFDRAQEALNAKRKGGGYYAKCAMNIID